MLQFNDFFCFYKGTAKVMAIFKGQCSNCGMNCYSSPLDTQISMFSPEKVPILAGDFREMACYSTFQGNLLCKECLQEEE